MAGATTLDGLGPCICILGPSNSGKSTLAAAIGMARGLPVVHLDPLHHLPDTDWQPRPHEDFVALHDRAIAGDAWVIEGNYSSCLPQRLARATGLIVLDVAMATSLLRYVRRCWFQRDRIGGLRGGRDSVKWAMIHHIVAVMPASRRRYRALVQRTDVPALLLATRRELAGFYRAEGLPRLGLGDPLNSPR